MYEEKMQEFDSMLVKDWREDANNLMILVSHRSFDKTYRVLLDYCIMIEWFGLSGRLRIPGTVLYFISNKLSRCLGLLPRSDLLPSASFERYNFFTDTSSSHSGKRTQSITRGMVYELGDEFCMCRGGNHGPRMDPPIPASDSAMVQFT